MNSYLGGWSFSSDIWPPLKLGLQPLRELPECLAKICEEVPNRKNRCEHSFPEK